LRFALTRAASPGHDVPLAEEWVEGARNFVNKLWNSARFVAMNLDGRPLAELEAAGVPSATELTLPERWILSRLAQVTAAVDEAVDATMAAVIEIVSAIRRFRSEHKIAPSKKIAALVVAADTGQESALGDLAAEISALAGLDRFELVAGREPRPKEQRLVAAGATIVIPLEGVVDIAAALAD